MNQSIRHIVVVGGGSAGWLTACVLAAEHQPNADIQVSLIESPNVQHIGVGEGTWPSMKATLERIGIRESDFLTYCNASFKQGSQFVNWGCGNDPDVYFHPFSAPIGSDELDITPFWQPHSQSIPFAHAVGSQPQIIDQQLAPKQIATPEYAFVANYGYHLDAGKFVELLTAHGKSKLGITHITDDVVEINEDPDDGYINAVTTAKNGAICGDLFIDCTGFKSLLLGEHYGIEFIEQNHILFNDRAIAAQVPYAKANAPIASATLATAQQAGWVWDIGLQNRCGIGYVYSSAHSSATNAEQVLSDYIRAKGVSDIPEFRTINIRPGYRKTFWHKNCVAVGMAAGFLEPLEASALVMVEMGAQYIAEQLPQTRTTMAVVASQYNHCFNRRWQQIIEFLKLHYVLSDRSDSDYWRDNKAVSSWPELLQNKLSRWQDTGPSHYDFSHVQELFPAASYQYVYYGMGGKTAFTPTATRVRQQQRALQLLQQNSERSRQLLKRLPDNRTLLEQIRQQREVTS